MDTFNKQNGVSVRAYKGDAMTLLAFDLQTALRKNLAGFTIQYYLKGSAEKYYIYNRLYLPDAIRTASNIPANEKNSTLYAPIQKMNWVHVPNTNVNTQNAVFGDYVYEVTPRYIVDGKLEALKPELTVAVEINVSPFDMKNTKIGFTRGFVSSVAYAKRFNVENNKVRPNKTDLLFDITKKADDAQRWNDTKRKYETVPYTYEEQHKWLGWQARERVLEFLDQVLNDATLSLKALAYDLNEPEVCKRLLQLASQGKLKILLDDAGEHGEHASMEQAFENLFHAQATGNSQLVRGHYKSLAHCKVFIQMNAANQAQKVLTGSTNFSTNGLYINSNHVLVFDNPAIAERYNNYFENSFSEAKLLAIKGQEPTALDYTFDEVGLPKMTITFAPHKKEDAQRIFDRISSRITKTDTTDVLFAIMKDGSQSSILSAVRTQLKNENTFTYGITDTISKTGDDYEVFLYKPNTSRGIRVAAKGIENVLPPPFGKVAGISGYAIHHKFIVVNFKGTNPVVYCGSSNLAFTPEQNNGDNLLEIFDKDIVTAFAIEALRLVDHFHWRNNEVKSDTTMYLDDLSNSSTAWHKAWFNPTDLKNKQRKLYIKA